MVNNLPWAFAGHLTKCMHTCTTARMHACKHAALPISILDVVYKKNIYWLRNVQHDMSHTVTHYTCSIPAMLQTLWVLCTHNEACVPKSHMAYPSYGCNIRTNLGILYKGCIYGNDNELRARSHFLSLIFFVITRYILWIDSSWKLRG